MDIQYKYKGLNDTICLFTKEIVEPFRSFKQCSIDEDKLWFLPKDIEVDIKLMEKYRSKQEWEKSDNIRKKLIDSGIVIKNGKNWYPSLLIRNYNSEKEFNNWLYRTWMKNPYDKPNKEKVSFLKKQLDNLNSELKEKYQI